VPCEKYRCAVAVTLVVTHLGTPPGSAAASQSLTFDQPRVVIGRGAHADVRLPARAVSDTHAVVRMDTGELSITDEGSTNGTAVNGQALVRGRKKPLRAGDVIALPGFEIVVEPSRTVPDPPDRTATVARKLLADALAAVGGEAAPPQLMLVSGRRAGQSWKLPPPPSRLVAGRGEICDVILDDPDCSRQHAEFVRDAEGVSLRDLGSKNGILVGGRRLVERRLRDGDEIRLGRTVLSFSDPAEQLLRAFDDGPDEPAALSLPVPPASPSLPAPVEVSPPPPVPPPGEPERPTAPPAESPAAERPTATPPAASARRPARRRDGRTVDWIVAALALVILAVSVAALFFLLRGSPVPPR
jgi:pSer/pThr/pTyr-binding forkhead associated (FHA) protein